jgi:mRNA interferase MazF
MNYQPGDVLLVAFPFTGGGQKQRPALVLADTGDQDVLLARITTQSALGQYDVPISGWQAAGLLAPSVVRLHKLATIDKRLCRRRLGALPRANYQLVGRALIALLAPWS